jgi:hypothetical protein
LISKLSTKLNCDNEKKKKNIQLKKRKIASAKKTSIYGGTNMIPESPWQQTARTIPPLLFPNKKNNPNPLHSDFHL